METLHDILKKQLTFRRVIMRRIWYSFALSIIARPALFGGFVFGASAILFWQIVSITSIVQNVLNVRVGDMPQYVVEALGQADGLALVSFIALCLISMMVIVRSSSRLLIHRAALA